MRRFCLPFLLISFLSACGASDTNPDLDGDGVVNEMDAFPRDALESVDSDGDGVGNNADAFPEDATETVDSDSDGVGDNSDAFPQDASESADSDEDGVGDIADAFPQDATESVDSDLDGVGDNSDDFPQDATESADSDGDGTGDNADPFPNDVDNDGIADVYEERTVSDASLVGTWVSIGENSMRADPFPLWIEESSKKYLVIRNSEDGLEMGSCTSGFTGISLVGDQVNLGSGLSLISPSLIPEGLVATVENNQKINAVSNHENEGGYLRESLNYQMVKISDSTAPIGSATFIVAGEETLNPQLYCFSESKFTLLQNGVITDGTIYRSSLENGMGFMLQRRIEPEISAYNHFKLGERYFSEENQDDVNFSIDNQDDLNLFMMFNASNDSTDISGNIQIQLPVQ